MCLKDANHVLFSESKVRICLLVKKRKCNWKVRIMCSMCTMPCNHFNVELVLFLCALKVFYWTCICFWKKMRRTDRQTDRQMAKWTLSKETRQFFLIKKEEFCVKSSIVEFMYFKMKINRCLKCANHVFVESSHQNSSF